MDISTRLNLSYPAAQSVQSVPVVADKQAVAPQVVPAPAAADKLDTATSKDSNPDKESKDLKAAVQEMEKFFQSVRRNLEFSIDEGSGQVVVKVIATETGEVVRQLPSAEALKIADSLKNANSLLLDAKV
ncbi:flagellar biosynthesis protein FlaG [Pseudomonas sp. Bc-h]|uniref:flagellar protein FlaG n=1 Tax=Pseudomonas sp. Bc-h TaxID=1943632 RepID=UPI0009DA9AF7|nr:flagellar protein FlaG [Pseudomonas sp. Bc-h]OQR26985.1 flagellar biosynthesis protein FlaG [Pseudomonas sp. Bc-h]